jgi:hypothetical protein
MDQTRRPGRVSRESPLGRVKRNQIVRASRAIYRRLCPPLCRSCLQSQLLSLEICKSSGPRSFVPEIVCRQSRPSNSFAVPS